MPHFLADVISTLLLILHTLPPDSNDHQTYSTPFDPQELCSGCSGKFLLNFSCFHSFVSFSLHLVGPCSLPFSLSYPHYPLRTPSPSSQKTSILYIFTTCRCHY
ncbi:hypothetical protein DEU56DRAFT_779141 [Suillus clintonianus]|uniref:uncharacterized protein n=1 Tax=Suillus clintonianus TaxID=1904413 RepID=UPI001B86032B|nr:uncharacterized protein DEU56DRAFT_779141 [Suillus clintonianus]KAG2150923.1 hypothetical protein DEU56DRAFT_779141 [Suillus clintonianus]